MNIVSLLADRDSFHAFFVSMAYTVSGIHGEYTSRTDEHHFPAHECISAEEKREVQQPVSLLLFFGIVTIPAPKFLFGIPQSIGKCIGPVIHTISDETLEEFLRLLVVQLGQFLYTNSFGTIRHIDFRQDVDDIFPVDSHKKDGPSPSPSPLLNSRNKTMYLRKTPGPAHCPKWIVELDACLLRASPPESALPQRHEKRPSCLNLALRLKQNGVTNTIRLDGHFTSLG
jgi:hypothetical protein